MRRRTSQARHGIRPAPGERGQYPVAQIVAVGVQCRVALVLDPRQSLGQGVGAQPRPWKMQQRPHQPPGAQAPALRHAGRHTVAQQAVEEGLGLIVRVMRQQQQIAGTEPLSEDVVARRPRARLGTAAAGSHFDPFGVAADAESRTDRQAMALPLIGVGR